MKHVLTLTIICVICAVVAGGMYVFASSQLRPNGEVAGQRAAGPTGGELRDVEVEFLWQTAVLNSLVQDRPLSLKQKQLQLEELAKQASIQALRKFV